MNKHRILIVDDEVALTHLLKLNLEALGKYEAREINESQAVLGAIKEFRPDLIILDVMMPGLDGGDIAMRLQASADYKHIPILFLTAAVRKEEVGAHGGVIGGFTYLAKPVSLAELVACMEKHLAQVKS